MVLPRGLAVTVGLHNRGAERSWCLPRTVKLDDLFIPSVTPACPKAIPRNPRFVHSTHFQSASSTLKVARQLPDAALFVDQVLIFPRSISYCQFVIEYSVTPTHQAIRHNYPPYPRPLQSAPRTSTERRLPRRPNQTNEPFHNNNQTPAKNVLRRRKTRLRRPQALGKPRRAETLLRTQEQTPRPSSDIPQPHPPRDLVQSAEPVVPHLSRYSHTRLFHLRVCLSGVFHAGRDAPVAGCEAGGGVVL